MGGAMILRGACDDRDLALRMECELRWADRLGLSDVRERQTFTLGEILARDLPPAEKAEGMANWFALIERLKADHPLEEGRDADILVIGFAWVHS